MMLIVLLALTQTPTTTSVSAHGHGRFFQGLSVGNSIELEAQVQPAGFVKGARPTGTVTFTVFDVNNVAVFGPTVVNLNGWHWRREAKTFWTPTTAGIYTVQADFTSANPGQFSDSTSTITITVIPANTRTHITPHFSFVLASNGVANFTVNLSTGWGCSWNGQATPVSGATIDITSSGGTVVTTPVITDGSGNATFQVTGLTTVGTYFVTATYAGDADHNASSDTATVKVVNSLPPHGGFWGHSHNWNYGYFWWHH